MKNVVIEKNIDKAWIALNAFDKIAKICFIEICVGDAKSALLNYENTLKLIVIALFKNEIK